MAYLNKFLALGTAAAIAVSATTYAAAAPIGIGSAPLAVTNAEFGDVTNVGWRGRRNTAIGLGILGGVLLGGALAHGAYHYPAPYYYTPAPQRCWVQTGPYRGQGYYAYC